PYTTLFRSRKAEVALAHARVERGVEHLEAVPLALRAPSGATESRVHGDVEEKRPVRRKVAAGDRRHRADVVERHAVAVPLVRHRRVEETVGDDDLARVERGANDLAHVLRAGGAVK